MAVTTMGYLRARGILEGLGVARDEPLERITSATNEVWMTRHLVVRMNRSAGVHLRREALLSTYLPAGVGYPPIVASGHGPGGDWLVFERIRGRSLTRCWPALPDASRREAVRQLAARLQLVHATPYPALAALPPTEHLLAPAPSGASAVAPLLAAIERAAALEWVDRSVMGDVADLVRSTAQVLDPFDAPTLVHGDLTFENVLWDGEHIIAILDFERARPGPPDLDLDVLLRFAAHPFLYVAAEHEAATLAEDYVDLPWWLAEDYPALFAAPAQFERARLFSVATDVQELLANPPTQRLGLMHPCHPGHRLVKLLSGISYLDRMNGSIHLDH